MNRIKLALVCGTALIFLAFLDPALLPVGGQQSNPSNNQTDKQGALQSAGASAIANWRPNKPFPDARYVGAQACVACHATKVKTHQYTPMGRALETVGDCQILRDNPVLTHRLGKYNYKITRQGAQSFYSVTDGTETVTEPILHCFGQGKAGQTYVFKHNGSFYESHVSFYNDTDSLDVTIGYSREVPASLDEALGRATSSDEIRSCYACHSTASVERTQLKLENLVPGISCEACHGPGEKHVLAMKAGDLQKQTIFNPGKLGGDALSQEFCAACHRSAEDVSMMPNYAGINNVRFQPYRIFNSPCYADDRRISCTACHNPHEDLRHDAAFYDSKCLACHTSKNDPKDAQLLKTSWPVGQPSQQQQPARHAPACPVETKNCVTCHMPKISLPNSHTTFTDHRIRVVKPGEVYPR